MIIKDLLMQWCGIPEIIKSILTVRSTHHGQPSAIPLRGPDFIKAKFVKDPHPEEARAERSLKRGKDPLRGTRTITIPGGDMSFSTWTNRKSSSPVGDMNETPLGIETARSNSRRDPQSNSPNKKMFEGSREEAVGPLRGRTEKSAKI